MTKKELCITGYLDYREAYVISKQNLNATVTALCLQLQARAVLNLEFTILDERNRRNSTYASAVENMDHG